MRIHKPSTLLIIIIVRVVCRDARALHGAQTGACHAHVARSCGTSQPHQYFGARRTLKLAHAWRKRNACTSIISGVSAARCDVNVNEGCSLY